MTLKNFQSYKITFSFFILLCIVFSMIIGCGSISENKKTATLITEDLFMKFQNGDFESSMDLYSNLFFQETSRDEWIDMLTSVQNKLGAIEKYELEGWKTKKMFTTSGSGLYWILQYKVKRSRHDSTETITLFKPSGGKLLIVGHNINSIGLLQD